MSAEVETMAFSGEIPWHGLGVEVLDCLTPKEMMVAASLDWTVSKSPLFTRVNGEEITLSDKVLIRDSDASILSIVGEDWVPNQNAHAFEFFTEFTEKGGMKMHTAGSLKGGRHVWALAKLEKNFTLFNGDRVEGYLLFSNPHQYGMCIDVRFTAVRVVCNNTLTAALSGKANQIFKSSHRVTLDLDVVKETIGLAKKKLDKYEELAQFLGSVRYTDENIGEFFEELFPSMSTKDEAKKSRNFKQAMLALTHQPGIEFAPGTFWQAVNAVSYVTDHIMARERDTRVYNMWYGSTQVLKQKAMKLAEEFAKRS